MDVARAKRFTAASATLCLLAATMADPPPPMMIVNALDANATSILNLTLGAPGSCSCQIPKSCNGHTIVGPEEFHGDTGCDYYAIGGGISTRLPSGDLGTTCNTWRADFKSCDVYPGSTDRECGRIVSATCTFTNAVGIPTVTLHAVVDMKCDSYHYENCQANVSNCCGGFKCQPASSGSDQHMCCPAGTGCIHDNLP